MNKRQAKKAYKKKYGHNPPKIRRKTDAEILAEAMQAALKTIKTGVQAFIDAMPKIVEAATAAAVQLKKWAEGAVDHIRGMPEEEFIKLMESEDLSREQKALLWKIRMSQKGA